MTRRKHLSGEYLKELMLVNTTERWIAHDEIVGVFCKYCSRKFSNKFCQIKRDYKSYGHGFRCESCKKQNNQSDRLRSKTPRYVTDKMKELNISNIDELLKIKELQFDGWIMKIDDFVSSEVMVTVKCICGTKKDVNRKSIYKRRSRSCGCLKKDLAREYYQKEYGVDHIAQLDSVKKKRESTMIKNHGVKHALQSEEVRGVMYKKYYDKTGYSHPTLNPEVKERRIKTKIENDYSSVPELELKEWIQSNFDVEAEKSYIGGNNPKEIDILIKRGDINILAIEYNGDYWHSEANKSMHKNYHKYKTEQVRLQKKCQLIHIFDSEWKEKKDIIKGFLRSKLERGISVRASKCEVREVSWEDAKEFCNNYHLQGKPQHSKLSLGLYHKGELISLMTFSIPHRQNMGSEYHLSRYAIKHGYRIHGGLSRLSKHAHKRIGDFITYVHLRLSSGDSYINSGYDHIGDVKPDYWYWDISRNKIVSKQSRRKSKTDTPKGISEKEHAEIDGLYRIWDCGKKKYIFKG